VSRLEDRKSAPEVYGIRPDFCLKKFWGERRCQGKFSFGLLLRYKTLLTKKLSWCLGLTYKAGGCRSPHPDPGIWLCGLTVLLCLGRGLGHRCRRWRGRHQRAHIFWIWRSFWPGDSCRIIAVFFNLESQLNECLQQYI
jgi:hypothetical protein